MDEKIEFLEKQIDNKTLGQTTVSDGTFVLMFAVKELLEKQNQLLEKIAAMKQPEVEKEILVEHGGKLYPKEIAEMFMKNETEKKHRNFLQHVFNI